MGSEICQRPLHHNQAALTVVHKCIYLITCQNKSKQIHPSRYDLGVLCSSFDADLYSIISTSSHFLYLFYQSLFGRLHPTFFNLLISMPFFPRQSDVKARPQVCAS